MARKLQPYEVDLFTIVDTVNQLVDGRSNNVGSKGNGTSVTLTPGATTTTVNFPTVSVDSVILLSPRTANAALSLSGSVAVQKQIFTSSGTYTPSPGMVYCIIEAVGSGGGGGGAQGAGSQVYTGGGGGPGGYSRLVASAATIGASQV